VSIAWEPRAALARRAEGVIPSVHPAERYPAKAHTFRIADISSANQPPPYGQGTAFTAMEEYG
jgi:hypothetical protein